MSSEVTFLSEVSHAIELKAEQMMSRPQISTAKQWKSQIESQFQEVRSQEPSMQTTNLKNMAGQVLKYNPKN